MVYFNNSCWTFCCWLFFVVEISESLSCADQFLSFGHSVILSLCYSVSPCHPVTLSLCYPVTLSPCHPVTLSHCHSVKHRHARLLLYRPCQRTQRSQIWPANKTLSSARLYEIYLSVSVSVCLARFVAFVRDFESSTQSVTGCGRYSGIRWYWLRAEWIF